MLRLCGITKSREAKCTQKDLQLYVRHSRAHHRTPVSMGKASVGVQAASSGVLAEGSACEPFYYEQPICHIYGRKKKRQIEGVVF